MANFSIKSSVVAITVRPFLLFILKSVSKSVFSLLNFEKGLNRNVTCMKTQTVSPAKSKKVYVCGVVPLINIDIMAMLTSIYNPLQRPVDPASIQLCYISGGMPITLSSRH